MFLRSYYSASDYALSSLFLQRSLDSGTRKRLEYEFHSACYHTIMEVVAGLRTSVGHLIKEVSGAANRQYFYTHHTSLTHLEK